MSTEELLEEHSIYKYGFVKPIERDAISKGLQKNSAADLSKKRMSLPFLQFD